MDLPYFIFLSLANILSTNADMLKDQLYRVLYFEVMFGYDFRLNDEF